MIRCVCIFFFQAEDGIRDLVRSRGLGDVYKRQVQLMDPLDWEEWIAIYTKMTLWEMEFDRHRDLGLEQTLRDQKREANMEFANFVEKNYVSWLENDNFDRPILSTDVMTEYVFPKVQQDKGPVFLFVIDCMRLDPVSYTHLRAHETVLDLVCRLLLEKKTTATTQHAKYSNYQ